MRFIDKTIMQKQTPILILTLVALPILSLFVMGSVNYSGNFMVYLLYSLVFNKLLFLGFHPKRMFFDLFIGLFLWLGFWLKFTIRVIFLSGQNFDGTGYFNFSPEAYDNVLFISSLGGLGFIGAFYFRSIFVFNYPQPTHLEEPNSSLLSFYQKYRLYLWGGLFILFTFIAISNAWLGIYQRGSVPRTVLPFRLSGLYKWLLLFGGTSFSALLLNLELRLKKKIGLGFMAISILECFFSSVSLLSRGMFVNVGSLFFGIKDSYRAFKLQLKSRFVLSSIIMLLALFAGSIFLVQKVRYFRYASHQLEAALSTPKNYRLQKTLTNGPLVQFSERWVGIDGVIAVASYPHLGWKLWETAWQERFKASGTTFYDRVIKKSDYIHRAELNKHHFVSMPGLIGFLFYPGSLTFLFCSIFILGLAAATIEIMTYQLGGKNLILCSLFAQVIAFRFIHFGYAPQQSYLLFGALSLNLIIIFIVHHFFHSPAKVFKKLSWIR